MNAETKEVLADLGAELLRLRRIEAAAKLVLEDMDDCGDYCCIDETKICLLEDAMEDHKRQDEKQNRAEAAYEDSLGEAFRGGESDAFVTETQAWIQRNLK